ncbi:MAG TPA: tRNA (adenosine(37)-N6)-threonylcarbamoyltransferase complex ATPase subunit type 1 TsaE [Ferruginibacter sp.]|jgi:tRNA threonylcarbamoyladenosine biosynthesis protein TsaE|nr:tRNA (adenosine(37)-N6)-threonylcarbamoyltransferase complex ATPase subunit type 1 TsaE [Ferruginibacter sp.]
MEVNFSLQQIRSTATALLHDMAGHTVFAFHGEMGAGKTTFIHALCEVMGVQDVVTSPTFSLINQYRTNDNKTVYHMDLYRIRDEQEAINAGIEDCLYSGEICLVEWPEKAGDIFPDDTVHITISSVDDNTRKLGYNL